jgi:hypothetical protein
MTPLPSTILMEDPPQEDRLSHFLSDRPKFKLYAAAQHLNNLRSIEARHESLVAPKARIPAEMEIDSYLDQMLGAVHSLFVQINEKLDLGITVDQLDFGRVQSALSAKTKKIALLSDLDRARQRGGWYWHLVELRNCSMLMSFSRIVVEGQNPTMTYFKTDPRDPDGSSTMDLEVIPYLEQCLSSMEQLIDKIRSNDPMLA